MPAFDLSTPTTTRKFSGLTFTVPTPFFGGHVLTDAEANFLNTQLASVVGNAFSGDIRRALEAYNTEAKAALPKAEQKSYVDVTDPSVLNWDMAAKFAARFTDYELGVSNRGGDGIASTSPLDRMIKFLATEDLKARLAAKGFKVGTFFKAPASEGSTFKSKYEELLAANIEKNHERFAAQAQAQLDAMAAADATDDGLLDNVEAPPETTPEAAATA